MHAHRRTRARWVRLCDHRGALIDGRVHLDADQYAERSHLIKRARDADVEAIVARGTGGGSKRAVLALARKFEGVM